MEIMKRRVLAAFLAMMLTCGVAFPGNAVYAAEVTETTAESDAAVEETAAQTTDAEAEAKPEGSTEQPETTEAAEAAVTEATETEDGYRYKKCTVCEEKVAEEVIPRLAWVNPFEDVPEDKWFYASVKYANQNNLFKGTSDTTFEPNTPMNRAMFCRVLANLEGVDNENNLTVDRFSDVLSGKWYTKAVKWAADAGIVSGYPGGIFLPEQKITRQEMCLMLANYAKYLGIYDDLAKKEDNGVAFADAAKIATWASEAVNVMKNNGYIVGKPIDGTYEFQPQATATRAEVATIFRAFCMANPTVLKK